MADTAAPKRRLGDLPHAQQAALLCQDPAFQRYAAERAGLTDIDKLNSSAAAEWLRQECRISSRKDLNTDPAARARFDQLRNTYNAWRGRTSAPR
jgi:hypothetical protein